MKQITIRHNDSINEIDALEYLRVALVRCKERTGIVIFRDGTRLLFSDRAKGISVLIDPGEPIQRKPQRK